MSISGFDLQTFTDFYTPMDTSFNMANHGAFAPDDDFNKPNRDFYHNLSLSLYPDFTKCDLDAATWHFKRREECYLQGFDKGGLGNPEAFSFGNTFDYICIPTCMYILTETIPESDILLEKAPTSSYF